jgi:hypothetical protein
MRPKPQQSGCRPSWRRPAAGDPAVEKKFSLPDQWSVRLFIALCRRYGIRPFR